MEGAGPVFAERPDKWRMLVVVALRAGPLRFNELRRSVPAVAQRMLTCTLRALAPAAGGLRAHLARPRAARAGGGGGRVGIKHRALLERAQRRYDARRPAA